MKILVFIAGEYDTDFRNQFVDHINSLISPNISNIDSQIIAISNFEKICEGDMKAAARSAKNKLKHIMVYASEHYVIIDNPNTHPTHWESYIETAKKLDENIFTVGFFIGKYKKWPFLQKFISSMDKYQCVEDESAFPATWDIIQNQNGETNVY